MTAAMALGAAFGLGVLFLWWALVPPRTDLAGAVADFAARPRSVAPVSTEFGPMRRATSAVARALSDRGLFLADVRTSLAIVGRTLEAHVVRKLSVALVGALIPVLVTSAVVSAGMSPGLWAPAAASSVLAMGFFVLPDVALAREAEERRQELRVALACYLDLVSMSLAGGRGAPEALVEAARIGHSRGFDEIASTLTHARYSGTSLWSAFSDLGNRFGVSELSDLGGSLALVADDGAKIRESLRARAATARARQLAQSEGEAERSSESIRNAHLLLGFAFLVFLSYPAIAAVMAI